MPEPRALGNVSRAVLTTIADSLTVNQDEFFDLALRVHASETKAAILAIKELASRNNIALRAITFLLADKQKEAEEVLISDKMRRKTYDTE